MELIRYVVQDVCDFTVEYLQDKGLISLYVAGTILTPDRTRHSDIDLFGLVDESYDFTDERALNAFFATHRLDLCAGVEARFHGIPLAALNGGKQEGVVAYFTPERTIRRLPFFTQVWGETFDFASDFSVKPLPLKDEALLLLGQIESRMGELRGGSAEKRYRNFPKSIVELARVEAEHDKGFKFDPSYLKLAYHLKDEPQHIVHKALALRSKGPTKEDILAFLGDAKRYVEEMKKKVARWA